MKGLGLLLLIVLSGEIGFLAGAGHEEAKLSAALDREEMLRAALTSAGKGEIHLGPGGSINGVNFTDHIKVFESCNNVISFGSASESVRFVREDLSACKHQLNSFTGEKPNG